MTRPPSRPTLKLPARPDSDGEAGVRRSPLRKPVRGGIKTAKPGVAGSARRGVTPAEPAPTRREPTAPVDRKPAIGATPPREETTRPRRGVAPAPRHESAAIPGREEAAKRPAAPAAKVYPKRGIARSTGARALPPPRQDETRAARPETPRPEPLKTGPRAKPTAGDRAEKYPKPRTAPDVKPHAKRDASRSAPQPAVDQPAAPRRPLKEPPRLSKRLTDMTQCSRREADEWIENGWVRVDGVVVTTLGTRAHPDARIEIAEEASKHQTEYVTILFNKAPNADLDSVKAVSQIGPANRWSEDDTARAFKPTHLRGMALAGRLDDESGGMLVLTQEGSVARRIVGDETRLEKEYMVRVEGELSPEGLKRLNFGLTLDEIKLKRAQVSWQHEGQLRFVLHENRKDQIRRMCEQVGLRVIGIKRIRIGSVSIGKLPVGQWRYLRANERF